MIHAGLVVHCHAPCPMILSLCSALLTCERGRCTAVNPGRPHASCPGRKAKCRTPEHAQHARGTVLQQQVPTAPQATNPHRTQNQPPRRPAIWHLGGIAAWVAADIGALPVTFMAGCRDRRIPRVGRQLTFWARRLTVKLGSAQFNTQGTEFPWTGAHVALVAVVLSSCQQGGQQRTYRKTDHPRASSVKPPTEQRSARRSPQVASAPACHDTERWRDDRFCDMQRPHSRLRRQEHAERPVHPPATLAEPGSRYAPAVACTWPCARSDGGAAATADTKQMRGFASHIGLRVRKSGHVSIMAEKAPDREPNRRDGPGSTERRRTPIDGCSGESGAGSESPGGRAQVTASASSGAGAQTGHGWGRGVRQRCHAPDQWKPSAACRPHARPKTGSSRPTRAGSMSLMPHAHPLATPKVDAQNCANV